MKLLMIAAIFISLADANWLEDFQKAQQTAKAENRLILLNFSGSDWCAPCIKMKKEIFEAETFINYASENLVLVRADFPRLKKNQLPREQVKKNEQLAERYNPEGNFPYTLLLRADGTVLMKWEGFQSMTPEEFVSQLSEYK